MSNQIERARILRKRLTPQEVKLWVRLRALRPLGYHFRRQVPIGPYIVDFACKRSNLAIEIDGGHHALDPFAAKDSSRDAFLRSQGFRIVRVWNSDVDHNLNGVMEMIASIVRPHPARKRAPPSPNGGGIRAAADPSPERGGWPAEAGRVGSIRTER